MDLVFYFFAGYISLSKIISLFLVRLFSFFFPEEYEFCEGMDSVLIVVLSPESTVVPCI